MLGVRRIGTSPHPRLEDVSGLSRLVVNQGDMQDCVAWRARTFAKVHLDYLVVYLQE
jgi:hypothetical protein